MSSHRLRLSVINPSSHRRYEPKKRFFVCAKQGGDSERKSIDDKMIILRMRIKKMKVLEARTSGDKDQGIASQRPSSDWKDWEKKLFTHYHEDVCQGIELLQSYLMNTRPSVALGTLMLLAMSVPLSSSVVMGNVLKVARGLLAGCHVSIDIDF